MNNDKILLNCINNTKVEYNADFFTPTDFEHAKKIVLGYGLYQTPNRWEIETNWIKNLFRNKKFLNDQSVVLDWGCGIGRLAKMIIETFNCKVIGVDINQKMLDYAKEYVNHPSFDCMLVEDFVDNNKTQFTNAIAVWTLQHSVYVDRDIAIIKNSLQNKGSLFVFEMLEPCIPIKNNQTPWGIVEEGSYQKNVSKQLQLISQGQFPKILNLQENDMTWYGFFQK